MAKLHETDLSSPIFKKVAILRKERTFLVFSMLHWEYAEDTHKGAGLYSSFHLRPANVQPGQPGAELPARPAGSKAPGNLGFMRKKPQSQIAHRAFRLAAGRRRYYLAKTGSGAVKARSVPARKPKFFDHFATSSAVNARRSPRTNPIFSLCVHSSKQVERPPSRRVTLVQDPLHAPTRGRTHGN